MGKKIDLNTRRNNSNFRKTTHNFNYNNIPSGLSQEDINSEEESNINEATINNYNSRREYDLPKNVNLTIKMPLPEKNIFIIIILCALLPLLVVFVIIFYSGDQFNSSGKYKLGQTCTTVTVKNTKNYIYKLDRVE